MRLAAAVTPGVVMTPASSILEVRSAPRRSARSQCASQASNAGARNPEPLSSRWRRGVWPRLCREVRRRRRPAHNDAASALCAQVIFGIGLNQLADFYAERTPIDQPVLRSMTGRRALSCADVARS